MIDPRRARQCAIWGSMPLILLVLAYASMFVFAWMNVPPSLILSAPILVFFLGGSLTAVVSTVYAWRSRLPLAMRIIHTLACVFLLATTLGSWVFPPLVALVTAPENSAELAQLNLGIALMSVPAALVLALTSAIIWVLARRAARSVQAHEQGPQARD